MEESMKKNDVFKTERYVNNVELKYLESILLRDGDLITVVVKESQNEKIRNCKENITLIKTDKVIDNKGKIDKRLSKENKSKLENRRRKEIRECINGKDYRKYKEKRDNRNNRDRRDRRGHRDYEENSETIKRIENEEIVKISKYEKKKEDMEYIGKGDIMKTLGSTAEVEIELWDLEDRERTSNDVSSASCDSPIVNELQQNTNARREGRISEGIDLSNARESTIHCIFQGKYNFVLCFKATNVRLIFLREEKRKMTTDACDKMIQPHSKYFYQSYIDRFSSKYMLMKKNHVLIKNSEKLWKSKSNTAIFKSNLYEEQKEKPAKSIISKSQKPDTRGFLYLNYNGITFLLNPTDVTLESLKPIFEEEIFQIKQAGDTTNNVRSRGTFLGKCKTDLLLFKFDIEKINFEQIWLRTSTATQSKDSDTYIKYYSYICNRMMHCPVPLSTYKYIDPMVKIKYRNKKAMFDGIMPSWKKEEKRKRLSNFCKLHNTRNSRIVELNYGSSIQFQTDGNLFCKAKTGVHDAQIIEGELLYETMIMEFQRQEGFGKKKDKDINLLADSKHTSIEVLDCDIISNNF